MSDSLREALEDLQHFSDVQLERNPKMQKTIATVIAALSSPQADAEAVKLWLYEDDLPDGYPYNKMFEHSEVRDGVRMFPCYAAPPSQSAEMRKALVLAEDVLSRAPFSTGIWPNGMHPQRGIEIIRKAISHADEGKESEESQAKATEGKAGMAEAADGLVRRSTAGTGLRVGEASADLPATSEFMDVTAGRDRQPSAPSVMPGCSGAGAIDREAIARIDEPYLVWSNEHSAWWAPNRCGYNTHISHAGRYTREEAIEICVHARGGREFNKNPSETPVLLRDAEIFWTEAGLKERCRREAKEREEEERREAAEQDEDAILALLRGGA